MSEHGFEPGAPRCDLFEKLATVLHPVEIAGIAHHHDFPFHAATADGVSGHSALVLGSAAHAGCPDQSRQLRLAHQQRHLNGAISCNLARSERRYGAESVRSARSPDDCGNLLQKQQEIVVSCAEPSPRDETLVCRLFRSMSLLGRSVRPISRATAKCTAVVLAPSSSLEFLLRSFHASELIRPFDLLRAA